MNSKSNQRLSGSSEGKLIDASDTSVEKKPDRLRSLDALRGFDMFWIVGGEVLVHKLGESIHWPWLQWLGEQMHHVAWEGFHFYDLIFPLFLFLAGVALPYSLGRRMEAGASKGKLLIKVAIRVALLIVLGIVYNGGLAFRPLAETRICSVLGLIGIGYGLAAVIFIYSRPRTMVVWTVAILLGYWAALSWIPVPEIGAGVLTPQGNLAGYLDRTLLPWRLNDTIFDPEGILPSLASTAIALMGAITGNFLRNVSMPKWSKGLIMLAAGCLLLGIAFYWGKSLPIVKKMWTSSFMLYCTGWSLILLSIFYLIIDVLGFWRWSFFFIVIGMNSILIYMGTRMVPLQETSDFLFGGFIKRFFAPPSQPWLAAAAYILTWWIILFYFYRKRCFLRV